MTPVIRKYHTDIYIPEDIRARFAENATATYPLTYTRHAEARAEENTVYHLIPFVLELREVELIEVTTEYGLPSGYVLRTPLEDESEYDLCLAVAPARDKFDRHILIVKTLWLNERTDIHKTLDRSQYEPAP